MNKPTPVAIVTGASRGIGAATAKLLAQRGYAVCVNYCQSQVQAEEIVKGITDAGGKAIAVKADVGVEAEVLALFKAVDKALGPVTALVNNAGTNGGVSPVESITSEKLQAVFSVNVFAPFLCCREALLRMKQVGHGGIVNISSEAARFGGNQLAHYAAAKAAINTFTIGFAREAAAHNVRVNTVSPGVIETEMHLGSSPDRLAALRSSLPLGRMGAPEEVAETVVWLLSEQASYLSGAIVPVTGGR